MLTGVERLNRAIGIVERVGPHPGRGHLVGAVAVVGGRAGRRRGEAVGRALVGALGHLAARRRSPGAAVGNAAGLPLVAARGAADHPAVFVFFFNDTATPEIYTLSLHDALPI